MNRDFNSGTGSVHHNGLLYMGDSTHHRMIAGQSVSQVGVTLRLSIWGGYTRAERFLNPGFHVGYLGSIFQEVLP